MKLSTPKRGPRAGATKRWRRAPGKAGRWAGLIACLKTAVLHLGELASGARGDSIGVIGAGQRRRLQGEIELGSSSWGRSVAVSAASAAGSSIRESAELHRQSGRASASMWGLAALRLSLRRNGVNRRRCDRTPLGDTAGPADSSSTRSGDAACGGDFCGMICFGGTAGQSWRHAPGLAVPLYKMRTASCSTGRRAGPLRGSATSHIGISPTAPHGNPATDDQARPQQFAQSLTLHRACDEVAQPDGRGQEHQPQQKTDAPDASN